MWDLWSERNLGWHILNTETRMLYDKRRVRSDIDLWCNFGGDQEIRVSHWGNLFVKFHCVEKLIYDRNPGVNLVEGKPRLLMQNGVDPCKLRWDIECTSFPPQEAPGRGWEAEMASWVSQTQAVKPSPGTNLPVYIFVLISTQIIIVVLIILVDLWTNWMFWNSIEIPKS